MGFKSANHIADILKDVSGDWVIESTGLMLGYQPEIFDVFKDLTGVFWRIIIKGSHPETFEKVTGARGEAYKYPLEAIEMLEHKVRL